MRMHASSSPRVTRFLHLLLGAVSLAMAAAAAWSGGLLMLGAAGVVAVFGLYNLIGVAFPSAVVVPRLGEDDADGGVLRLAHGVGALVATGVSVGLFYVAGINPLSLFGLTVGAYSFLGALLEPYLVPVALFFGVAPPTGSPGGGL